MKARSIIVQPSALAAQLSAISGRPAIFKHTPRLVVNNKPRDVSVGGAFGEARRASLLKAVETFNAE